MKKIGWKIDDGKNSGLLISERRKSESGDDHFERMVDMATDMVYEEKMNYQKIKIEMFEVIN